MLYDIVSRLNVNFYKSMLVGINVNNSRFDEVESFLSCKVETTPFEYLRVSIVTNLEDYIFGIRIMIKPDFVYLNGKDTICLQEIV